MHLRSTVTALAAVSLAFSSPFSRPSGDAVNSDGVLIEGAQSAGSAMAKVCRHPKLDSQSRL